MRVDLPLLYKISSNASKFVFSEATTMRIKLILQANAASPITVTFLGMVMLVRRLSPANAYLPIEVTSSPMITLVSSVAP